MNEIKSNIISMFGGVGAVAKICGVTAGAVSQWEIIPARHQMALLAEARRQKMKFDPSCFYFLPTQQKPTKKLKNS